MTTHPSMPRWRELVAAILVHPFEGTFGVILVLLALQEVGLGLAETRVDTAVGPPIATLWLFGNLVGGLGILAGVLRSGSAACRAAEKAGLYLVASTTAVYAVATGVIVGRPATYSVSIFIAVGVGCVLRAIAISKSERAVLRVLSHVNALAAHVHPVELVEPRRRATDRTR